MSFNGNEGEMIDLNTGAQWTANYRDSQFNDGVNSIFYGKNNLLKILNQANCVGIRIYKAIDQRGAPVMVLVGADANENDQTSGYILERGSPCPPNCGGGGGASSPLQG